MSEGLRPPDWLPGCCLFGTRTPRQGWCTLVLTVRRCYLLMFTSENGDVVSSDGQHKSAPPVSGRARAKHTRVRRRLDPVGNGGCRGTGVWDLRQQCGTGCACVPSTEAQNLSREDSSVQTRKKSWSTFGMSVLLHRAVHLTRWEVKRCQTLKIAPLPDPGKPHFALLTYVHEHHTTGHCRPLTTHLQLGCALLDR